MGGAGVGGAGDDPEFLCPQPELLGALRPGGLVQLGRADAGANREPRWHAVGTTGAEGALRMMTTVSGSGAVIPTIRASSSAWVEASAGSLVRR